MLPSVANGFPLFHHIHICEASASRIFAEQRCTSILYHIHTRKASASLSPHGENFTLRKQCFTPDTVRHFTHLCRAKMHIHISSHPHLRKQALHFRRRAKTSHCASNASRIFAEQRCTSILYHIHTRKASASLSPSGENFTLRKQCFMPDTVRRFTHLCTAKMHKPPHPCVIYALAVIIRKSLRNA